MMKQSRARHYPYKRGERFQAVKLPYGEAGRVEMVIVLPDAADGLAGVMKELEGERWKALFGGFDSQANQMGWVELPRFRIEYETQLNAPLKALGMAEAFDRDRADFSRMIAPPPTACISEVKHKAFVDVNETGTEAAAATSVRMELTMAPVGGEVFRMVVDRPFLCAIRDGETGELLFLGAICQP
jgi:serpin B